jgi:hypothetical protein
MYVKVMNRNLIHNGYQYEIGLNDLDKCFEKNGSCVKGGLYVTNVENVSSFFHFGDLVYIVKIPEFDSKGNKVEWVIDPDGNKFRSTCIELRGTRPLVSNPAKLVANF